MERLQPAVERIGLRGSQRFENNTEQAVETRCSDVQQVTCLDTECKCIWTK